MSSDLSSYLASRYLVANPKTSSSKKRKRKPPGASSSLLITDNDNTTWVRPTTLLDEQDDDGLITASGLTADFRKVKKSNWKRVGRQDQGSTAAAKDDAKDADAIIEAIAAERQAANAGDDEAPAIGSNESLMGMSDGTYAGLQSTAAVSVQLRRRQRLERQAFESKHSGGKEEETVYRDATGRRIDVSMKRSEARRAAAEAQQKDLKSKRDLKGLVQLEQARTHQGLLRDAQLMPLARTADDEELNLHLRGEQRWNDPMNQFLGQKQRAPGPVRPSKRRPVYSGTAPPNRYSINPGYRWDGVDRGNGFEAQRFKTLNRRERNKGLQYSWQMDE